ncbi:YitT family protein [Mollicutes bacterium LVI A0039]|nr:YitT family protein [Mollicutes bacterium LVI A0039]
MNYRKNVKEILIIISSALLYVIGTNIFLAPINLYAIGIPGFARQISDIINMVINVGDLTTIIYYVINAPIMILSFKRLGKRFSILTLLMITFVGIFSAMIPDDILLLSDPILAVFVSATLMGLALGFVLNIGGSTGGTDPIAVYYSMYKNKSVGTLNMLINGIIVIIAGIINADVETIVLMVLLLFIWKVIVDYVHNVNQKITLIIITENIEELREALFKSSYRSCTYWNAIGAYQKRDKKMIMITVSAAEYHVIVNMAKAIDDKVWINSFKSTDVVGNFNNYYQTNILR